VTVDTLALTASDVTGQKVARATSVPSDSTIGELVKSLLGRMGLVQQDASGQPLTYRARLEREGRNLHGSELVRDALRNEDELVLQPHVTAG
jgi:hypothetical protein